VRSFYRPDYEPHQASYRRAQRRRRAVQVAKGAGALALAAAAVAFAAVAWRELGPGWLRARAAGAGIFRLESVRVTGNRRLPEHLVLEAAGLRTGESLLGIDLATARARLKAHPWVAEASLRRRLPGTLLVEIAERVPAVIVRAESDYLVDREGVVIGPAGPGATPELPVLTGVEAAGGALTTRGAEDVAVGIELVAAIREAGFPALEAIARLDFSDPEDAVIVPVSGRPLVHAGRGDFAARLGRWKLVAPDMAGRWPELEYVDLRAEGQVVALPVPPPAREGAGAKAAGAGRPAGGGREPAAAKAPAAGRGAGRAATGGRDA
jgi:cell division protein FtsQ